MRFLVNLFSGFAEAGLIAQLFFIISILFFIMWWFVYKKDNEPQEVNKEAQNFYKRRKRWL